MTEWERQKEWKEFTHAARVYQPLTTSLASRFTRAQNVEDKEERPKVHSSGVTRMSKLRGHTMGTLSVCVTRIC